MKDDKLNMTIIKPCEKIKDSLLKDMLRCQKYEISMDVSTAMCNLIFNHGIKKYEQCILDNKNISRG